MPKADVKSKSTRKPLRELANGACISSVKPSKKKSAGENRAGDSFDRLLLVHSDLASLIHQIDELVVQALKLKVDNKKERKEVESFSHCLAEMHTSLKPWIPRFQKTLSSNCTGSENWLEVGFTRNTDASLDRNTIKAPDSPDPSKFSSLISPSPLVSWRATDCTTDCGRQLFLLTPIPRPKVSSSKLQRSTNIIYGKIIDDASVEPNALFPISGDVTDESIVLIDEGPIIGKLSDPSSTCLKGASECGFVSPERVLQKNNSFLASTPCLKASPPKSCLLLEPIAECCRSNNYAASKSIQLPVGTSRESESSGGPNSNHLALKYPEIFGINLAHKLGTTRKVVEEMPNWFTSPLKTCVLLEPSDEKPVANVDIKEMETNVAIAKENVIDSAVFCNKVVESTPMLKNPVATIECTPMMKDPNTTIQRGKRAGENTLKKELWTRFEAATVHGFRYKTSVVQEAAVNKGFLDLLEEASER